MADQPDPRPAPSTDPGADHSDPAGAAAASPADPSPAPAAGPASPTGPDLARRRFFRQFAGELFQGAATVVGAAQALQRVSAEAAGAILDPSRSAEGPSQVSVPVAALVARSEPTGFRTPYRESPGVLHLIDQRRLPDAIVEYDAHSAAEVAFAIRETIVHGTPAIGQAAAIGLALTAEKLQTTRQYARRATLRGAAQVLINARPTSADLRWAVDRVMAAYTDVGELDEDGEVIARAMRDCADTIVFESSQDQGRLAAFGLELLDWPADRPLRVLTHGNTGPLAAGQFGTALGVVQAAHHAERPIHVWVGESRPSLHGARLTAWELDQAGVSHTLIPDVAAGHLMARGEVDVVLVGADRIAANGDTANIVGTYPLAVLAARHHIPFYLVAQLSALDLDTPDGEAMPLEDRKANELLFIGGQRVAPVGTTVHYPAVDVTPAELITAMITDEGVVRAPYGEGLAAAAERRAERRASSPTFADLAATTQPVAVPS